jgi:hypothetical protein
VFRRTQTRQPIHTRAIDPIQDLKEPYRASFSMELRQDVADGTRSKRCKHKAQGAGGRLKSLIMPEILDHILSTANACVETPSMHVFVPSAVNASPSHTPSSSWPPSSRLVQQGCTYSAGQHSIPPLACLGNGVLGSVLEEFFDEIDVGHDHSAAAVSFAAQLVHGISVAAND